jgi:hypothetical protein
MMLADPRFVVPELVEPLDQLKVSVERERRVLVWTVEGGQEDAKSHELLPCVGGARRASCRAARAVNSARPGTHWGQDGIREGKSAHKSGIDLKNP